MSGSYFTFTSAGLTDQGLVRANNEDSILQSPETGVWVVADGAGGHSSGDVASSLIVDDLKRFIPVNHGNGNNIGKIFSILDDINNHLIELGESKRIIGSTVTVFFSDGKSAFVVWAGDSPLFLLRNNKLIKVIEDHNRQDEFIRKGFTEIECKGIPQAQQLTRAIGASVPLAIETRILPLKKDDLYVICSDGLTKELTEGEIENILINSVKVDVATKRLVDASIEKGARDNVSVIVIKVDKKHT